MGDLYMEIVKRWYKCASSTGYYFSRTCQYYSDSGKQRNMWSSWDLYVNNDGRVVKTAVAEGFLNLQIVVLRLDYDSFTGTNFTMRRVYDSVNGDKLNI